MTRGEVRDARKKLGLSQVEFGRRVGVAANTVSRWELGTLRVGSTAAILIRLLAEQAPRVRRKGR